MDVEPENYISFLPDSEPEEEPREVPKETPAKRPRHAASVATPKQPPNTNTNTNNNSSKNRNPWLRPVHSYSRKPSERLTQEVRDLIAYLAPTEAEKRARRAAMERVSMIVERVCGVGAVKVLPFGSYHMDLYLPSSDIDLVVVFNNTTGSDEDQLRVLRRIARAIGKSGTAAPSTLKVISKARVPIIKYVDKVSGYAVDVSVNVASGLEGAKMMVHKLAQHPALRPLTLFLKHYLTLRGLNEVFTGGLGSFSLMCMVVSFLEQHPLLQLKLVNEADNVAVLLLDFLELYSKHFNYDQVGIRLSPKSTYFARSSRSDWSTSSLLSIEDPQSPDNDLSKGSFQFGAVRQALEHAFLVMTSRMSRAEHEHRHLHILEPLVWIPERLIRHRQFIEQSVD